MKTILLFLLIIPIFCSCGIFSQSDIRHYSKDFSDSVLLKERIHISEKYPEYKYLNKFQRFSFPYEYSYGNESYIFTFLGDIRGNKIQYLYSIPQVFVLIDHDKKEITIIDSIIVESMKLDFTYKTYVTMGYLYIPVTAKGRVDIYAQENEDVGYEGGIILIKRDKPKEVKFYKYNLQEVIKVYEKDSNLVVETVVVEPHYNFEAVWINSISGHFRKGYWTHTFQTYRYVYDQDLNLIYKEEFY
jgi:hypothetical protein